MKIKFYLLIAFFAINLCFCQDTNGVGFSGTTYLSPVEGGKNYYGVNGSYYLRRENNVLQMKLFTGLQFHELVKIIDLGISFRVQPIKNIYLGISHTSRVSTLKETENTEAPLAVFKDFGTAHLGYSIPVSENFKIELEGNYNYFYKSEAAGYGFTLGLVFYNDELLSSLLSVLSKKS